MYHVLVFRVALHYRVSVNYRRKNTGIITADQSRDRSERGLNVVLFLLPVCILVHILNMPVSIVSVCDNTFFLTHFKVVIFSGVFMFPVKSNMFSSVLEAFTFFLVFTVLIYKANFCMLILLILTVFLFPC